MADGSRCSKLRVMTLAANPRTANASTIPLRERGTATFKPPDCRALVAVQAQSLPLRWRRGPYEPSFPIGPGPLVSARSVDACIARVIRELARRRCHPPRYRVDKASDYCFARGANGRTTATRTCP